MANDGNIGRVPALAQACRDDEALMQSLTRYRCSQNHVHNLLRNGGAAVSIPLCVRTCPTPECRKHEFVEGRTSMTNYRKTIGRCLTKKCGRPRNQPIEVVHAREGGQPLQRPVTPPQDYYVPWDQYEAMVQAQQAAAAAPAAAQVPPLVAVAAAPAAAQVPPAAAAAAFAPQAPAGGGPDAAQQQALRERQDQVAQDRADFRRIERDEWADGKDEAADDATLRRLRRERRTDELFGAMDVAEADDDAQEAEFDRRQRPHNRAQRQRARRERRRRRRQSETRRAERERGRQAEEERCRQREQARSERQRQRDEVRAMFQNRYL